MVTLGKHWQLAPIIKISKQKISEEFTKKIQLLNRALVFCREPVSGEIISHDQN